MVVLNICPDCKEQNNHGNETICVFIIIDVIVSEKSELRYTHAQHLEYYEPNSF